MVAVVVMRVLEKAHHVAPLRLLEKVASRNP